MVGSVLDPVWVAQVRAELRWLGERLGPVRDADVLALVLPAPAMVPRSTPEGAASSGRAFRFWPPRSRRFA